MKTYDHTAIEKKWSDTWAQSGIYTTPDARPDAAPPSQTPGVEKNEYVLVEYPYPSGNLHIGHWYAFALPDIYARYQRMQGKNVLFPIGFDSFGLPAENAAIKRGLDPRKWTYDNIAHMEGQLRSMGNSFDWSRKVVSSDPEYYKWTQWLFLKLYEKGLAYKKRSHVPWCDSCKTVLANEQIVNGACERCGSTVMDKELDQWYFKITDYAERLLEDLDELDWPEEIKQAQREWIGRSEGSLLRFEVKSQRSKGKGAGQKVKVLILHGFTGRADKEFIPWLKIELEKRGYDVQAPQMPNTDAPTEEEQVSFVLESCSIDENTVLVGHSLGGVVAMKVIEKIGNNVAGLVLVAPAVEAEFRTGEPRNFWQTFDITYDYKAIVDKTGFRTILSDSLEKEKRGPYLEYLSGKIDAQLAEGTAQEEHFCGDKEPTVLEAVIAPRPHRSFSEGGRNDEARGETKQSSGDVDDLTTYNLQPTIYVEVFTTRADTLYGATYLVLAPEHKLVAELLENSESGIENYEEVQAYIEATKKKKELERKESKEKTGVELKGIKAINPGTQEEIPVWIADYVLASYGTGAIMAVPAHDERDWEFAKTFGLPVRTVIADRLPTHAAALLESKQRPGTFLFQKRGADAPALPGQIALFGGGIEPGETVHEALARELREELELVLQTGVLRDTYTYPSTVSMRHVWVAHVQDVDDEQLVLHEGEAIVPMTLAEARAHPDLSETIRELIGNIVDGRIHAEQGVLIESGVLTGLTSEEAKTKITEYVGGKVTTQYRLRDWLLSRQRYWGCPIPIVYDPEGTPHAVPDEHLPWELPDDVDFTPTGEAPLAKSEALKKRTEDIFGKGWTPEVDTMDTFVDSSWYFLRYLDPHNAMEFSPIEKQKQWMPVNRYSGGAEHTTMHLLYSRFFQKALYDLGLVTVSEPYEQRMNRGLILGPDGAKMSKSKGNVIDPDENVARVGADTVKMYLAFIGPYNEPGQYPWDLGGIAGIRRFLERVFTLSGRTAQSTTGTSTTYNLQPATSLLLHQTIKKVTDDIPAFKYNTAISALMVLVNHLEKLDSVPVPTYEILIRLLAPFAPFLTEELWEMLGHATSVHLERWPGYDEAVLARAEVTIAVQVNGKTRATFTISPDTDKAAVLARAKELPLVAKWLTGTHILKEVYVPGRLVNIVIPA